MFLRQLFSRMVRVAFLLRYRFVFGKLGRGAYLFQPFRVDGSRAIEIGRNSLFQRGTWLYCIALDELPAVLKVGNGCVFGYNNHIASVREVIIGDYVLTANNVYISDNLHGYEDVTRPIIQQPVRFKKAVSIGEGSWIGENACIVGASIGRNCVIGSNAVVTRDIPDFSVAVGIPAVVIRQYDPQLQAWVTRDVPRTVKSE